MPARNGAWNRPGSVAVEQLHRSVWKNAANHRGESKPLRREIRPAFVLQDPSVEFVVPEDGQRLALGIVVCTCEIDLGGLTGRWDYDVLDQPATGSDLNQLADIRRSLRESVLSF